MIDILQTYDLQKKLEHGYKTIRFGDDISAVDADTYAARFTNRMASVFQP